MIATQKNLNRLVYITIIIRRKIAMAIIQGRVLVYPRTDWFSAGKLERTETPRSEESLCYNCLIST